MRQPAVGRLIQLAAACGVAVFTEAEAPNTVAAMRRLLEAAILADQGLVYEGRLEFSEKEERR